MTSATPRPAPAATAPREFPRPAAGGLGRIPRAALPHPFADVEETRVRARLDAGGDEQLGRGFGSDHRADVASVEHRPAILRGKSALTGEQRLAHWRVDRDPTCKPAGLLVA